MKKLSRVLLYLLGAFAAVLATLLLGVNLYVQSHSTQARIQEELSRRIGTTLRIERISVTPWWGLKLTGITIPQDNPALARDFLHAQAFRLRIRFLSLFARELVIKEVSLVNPTVVWAQNKDGKWRLPSRPEEAQPAEASAARSEARTAATASPDVPIAAKEDANVAPAPPSSFTPEVRRVSLANGNFHFLDAQGKPVATFAGFGFRSSLRNSTALRGNATVAKISLRDRFFLEHLESPVKYDPTELEFSRIAAQAAEGRITGFFSMRPADPGSPFTARVEFRDLQADEVVTRAGGPSGMVEGRIEGKLEATGKTADPNALSGVGEIYLRDGQLRQYTVLVALGQLLQIDELAELRFEQAHVKYHIEPGVVMIDELLLNSPNLRVAAQGTVSFDGKLRLQSKLAINERIRSRLFRGMRESFQATDEPGYTALDFKISGTVAKPKTDLMGKLVGRDLRDLGGIIGNLLGGGKQKRKERPAEAASPPAGTDVDDPAQDAAPAAEGALSPDPQPTASP